MGINDRISDTWSAIAESAIVDAVVSYGSQPIADAWAFVNDPIGEATDAVNGFRDWLDQVGIINGTDRDGQGNAEPPSGLPCPGVQYRAAAKWIYQGSSGDRLSSALYQTGYPPFELRVYQPGELRPDGNTRTTASAYISRHDVNGNEIIPVPTDFDTANAKVGDPGRGAWLRLCRGTTAPTTGSNPANGSGQDSFSIIYDDTLGDGAEFGCPANNPISTCPVDGNEEPPTAPPLFDPQDGPNGPATQMVPDGYGYAGGQPAVCFRDGGTRFCFGPGGTSVDFNADGIPEIDPDPLPLPTDGEGGSDGPQFSDENEDGKPDIEDCVCGDGSEQNSWPLVVPRILTQDSSEVESLAGIPQAIAWLVRNIDATTGSYPIKINIEDTDPTTPALESSEIEFPNPAEFNAELFGLAYETNQNLQIAVTAIMQLIPEVIATKNAAIINQDFITTIAEYMGMRTEDKEINVTSNFNPERPDNLQEFFSQSNMVLKGVKDADPHTMVQWLQKIHYWAQLAAIPSFRSESEIENLEQEIDSLGTEPIQEADEAWDQFREYVNNQVSTLNRDDANPRPKIIPLIDPTEPGATIPPVNG